MTSYPRDLTSDEISPALSDLVFRLAQLMLAGPTPAHRILQAQLAAAHLRRLTLTGAGLYAYFAHPDGGPPVSPPTLVGGEVELDVSSLDAPAGSLLAVNDGFLDFLEIYTFGEKPWPDAPQGVSVRGVTFLPIPKAAT